MWVHLLVIALLVYILWLVTKRRDSMYRPGRYTRKKLRNIRERMKAAQKAKDLNDLVAMYQAKMARAGAKGNKKLAAQYQKQINSIRKAGTLQNYRNSLKKSLKKVKKGGRAMGRRAGKGMRALGRRAGKGVRGMGARGGAGAGMQMPVGNYYFYFNTVPKGGPSGGM